MTKTTRVIRAAAMSVLFVVGAAVSANAGVTAEIDPLMTRWTFGAHEPYSMYRRMGKKSTGGIEGSAKWVREWLDWWDAKAPETVRGLKRARRSLRS